MKLKLTIELTSEELAEVSEAISRRIAHIEDKINKPNVLERIKVRKEKRLELLDSAQTALAKAEREARGLSN